MKVYSIGRENGCNIVINDHTDVISRRHAILNVAPTGKMTIVDQSKNGTYVNGMRIASNVPYPVTRKDSVSFAHVVRLDWNMVPNPFSPLRYAAIGVIALIVIAGASWGIYSLINSSGGGDEPRPVVSDTTNVQKESKEDIKKAVVDSIAKVNAKNDSIAREKAKSDSIAKAKADKKKKTKKSTPNSKNTGTKKADGTPKKSDKQENQTRFR